jgi:hypothetical protein
MKPESKFWLEVKKNIKEISFTRLESWASAGVPDLLCCNKNGKFFTVELKVTKGNFIKFSAHQIAFQKKALGPCAIKLYAGSDILKLVGREPCTPVAESWSKVQETFVNVT